MNGQDPYYCSQAEVWHKSLDHLYRGVLGFVESCVLSAATGQPKGGKKHHDTTGNMMAAS